jgi:hypothetical protein
MNKIEDNVNKNYICYRISIFVKALDDILFNRILFIKRNF